MQFLISSYTSVSTSWTIETINMKHDSYTFIHQYDMILWKTFQALKYCHDNDIIHRDIKVKETLKKPWFWWCEFLLFKFVAVVILLLLFFLLLFLFLSLISSSLESTVSSTKYLSSAPLKLCQNYSVLNSIYRVPNWFQEHSTDHMSFNINN